MQDEYALELIKKGNRLDGRKLDEFREIKIIPKIIKKAEGSAQVSFGDTKIIAGIKMEVGTPFADTLDEGILIVNAEFTPLASPDFESGPPRAEAIELARVVDRGLRESKCIELDKMVITPGEKVWITFVDLYMINHHGNLLDASALAAITALRNTKVPKLEKEQIVRGEYKKKLPVVHKPINITVGKVNGSYLLDPVLEEEKILNSRLSIAVREDDKICSLQKMGGSLSFDDVDEMINLVIKKSKELRKLVK